MSATIFADTNVFIYAVDAADPAKQVAAQTWRHWLWETNRGRLSFQVLQEFYVKATQKWPPARDEVRRELRDLLTWEPIPADAHLLERAWSIQDRYGLSFWDALIVAAAKTADCRYLLTEDLQPGQEIEGVLVVNPFLREPPLP
jgi:predicted nucleic acid-binding protein